MNKGSIPLQRLSSARRVEGDNRVEIQFEAEQRDLTFPALSIPMDQVPGAVALLIGASGKRGGNGKPVGVVSPERHQVFTHESDPGSIFLAFGVGTFDLAFTLDREKAIQLKQALAEALK